MPRQFTDLLIVPSGGDEVSDEEWEAHPPAVGPLVKASSIDLGEGVALEFIEDAEPIMDACEPRGENFSPARQYGQRYTFVRRNAPELSGDWDDDGVLHRCVVLSRLVSVNPADMHYAVRVEETDEADRILQPTNGGYRAWVARLDERFWLDEGDAKALAALHERYVPLQDRLGDRLSHAMWLCEYGFRIAYTDVAIPHYVTCLEALLNTDEQGSGRQFRERVPQLAQEVGVDLDEAFCRRIWKDRSKAVHGVRVSLEDHAEAARDLARIQTVSRLAIRRSIEDEGFLPHFATTPAVRVRFPVSDPPASGQP